MLGVAATTATAGIIVGVVTLTGLGLKIAGIIVALAGGHLFLTVLYSADLSYAARWSDMAGFAITAVVLILHFNRQPDQVRTGT